MSREAFNFGQFIRQKGAARPVSLCRDIMCPQLQWRRMISTSWLATSMLVELASFSGTGQPWIYESHFSFLCQAFKWIPSFATMSCKPVPPPTDGTCHWLFSKPCALALMMPMMITQMILPMVTTTTSTSTTTATVTVTVIVIIVIIVN